MIVGRFGSGSAYAGRIVRWDGEAFQADQIGRVDLVVLLDSETREQFIWSSPELTVWAHSGAECQPPGLGEAAPAPDDGPGTTSSAEMPIGVGTPATTGDGRTWLSLAVIAIVLIVVAALALAFVVKAPGGPRSVVKPGTETTATPAK